MKYCIKILLMLALLMGVFLSASAELEKVTLTDGVPQTFTYTPAANGVYSVALLPQDGGEVRAELLCGDEPVAFGTTLPTVLGARLVSDTEYTLRLTGSGTFYLEFARETLSRSASKPLTLADGGEYAKLIARDGDVHWYEMTAETDGAALIVCAPDGELSPVIHLFSEEGVLLGTSESLPSGAGVLSAELTAGQKILLRISAEKSGKYLLSVGRSASTEMPSEIALSAENVVLEGRSTENIYTYNSSQLIYFDSSNRTVATVAQDGTLQGVGAGQATITAYAYGGARAQCAVTVTDVAPISLEISAQVTMFTGDTQAITAQISPANALYAEIKFASSDENVLTVDENGRATALSEGSATVTAQVDDLVATAEIQVAAAPCRHRALLIGEQNYASTVDEVRTGSVLSVESVENLLNTADFDGVTTLTDPSRDEVVSSIRGVFGAAADGDVSVLYLTCHGFYRGGMTFFVMANGSVLSARELLVELEKLNGDVVLLLDCCGSGGVIGAASTSEDILSGIDAVFQGEIGPAARGQRIHVLASAFLDQNSYRISFSEGEMSTVFARVICDALGWSIDRGAASAMNADADYDGAVTMSELARYARRRANWYLSLAGGYAQTVCAYPDGDVFVVFSR